MRPDEIARVARIASDLGVRKIKITGGEPLLRKDIAQIINKLSEIKKIALLSITTNGILLEEFLEKNPEIPLDRINVSLDTLKEEVYAYFTGKNAWNEVVAGIKKASSLGMLIEINMLVLKDNVSEIDDMIRFANEIGANIQLIELVKTEENKAFYEKHFYPMSKVEEFMEKKADKIQRRASKFDRMVYFVGGSQIVTCKVVQDPEECSGLRCKLLRITADGKIRFFMIHDDEYVLELLNPMRKGASDEEIKRIFLKASQMRF